MMILCMMITFVSCKNNETIQESDEITPDRTVEIDTSRIKYLDPDKLYEGMPRQEVEDEYGEPIDSIGSGVSIIVFMSDKETMLVLYFDPGDKLHKVESVDKDSNTTIILGQ